ncbi:hypothetical protein DRH14_02305 [Candidatus Shapirobacteria bacterium]|nr:MAG: hypothetical protein DRH14_02305 [Candidatus Shapirobacteria bacterium]
MTDSNTIISKIKFSAKYAFFDLGGVVFTFSDGLQAIAELIHQPLQDIVAYWNLQDNYICMGKLDPQQFWIKLTSHFSSGDPNMDFVKFWVSHFKPIQETHNAIKILNSEGFPIGIITNIYPRVFRRAMEQGMIPNINYQTIVQSCDLGITKPNLQIFTYAINQTDLTPRDVILVDNIIQNTQAVTRLGWNSFLLK